MDDPFPSVSAAPDAIEPIVGWRGWSLRLQDGRVELGAVFADAAWPARSAMHARCGVRPSRRHRAPDVGCTCGIYAARHPMSFAGLQAVFQGPAAAIGTVALWGKVIEHADGYRAEFAYPDRLRLVCRHCAAQGLDGVPASVVELGGKLSPVCREHDVSNSRHPRHAVDDIERKVLVTYAVDLLSLESLREASFRSKKTVPATVTDVAAASRRRLRGTRTWWAVLRLFLLFLLLRGLGVLGPERAPSSEPPPPPPARLHAITVAYPVARDQVLHGLGPPEVTLPPVGGFAFVCGKEVAIGVVSLARCDAPSSFAGSRGGRLQLIGAAPVRPSPGGRRSPCVGSISKASTSARQSSACQVFGGGISGKRPDAPSRPSRPRQVLHDVERSS